MTKNAPGKAHREGISLIELANMFPDERVAHEWFAAQRWGETGRHCPHCGGTETTEADSNLRYWCGSCRNRFSIKTGTAMECSKVPLRKWAFAIYIDVTSLKSVSSMKLHRDLRVTQKTAWFMLHRIREAFSEEPGATFEGPVEVDETYMGGRRRNMSAAKRKTLTGRGAVGKTAVAGMRDRPTGQIKAKVVERVDRETVHGFIEGATKPETKVYTDEARAYRGMAREHETVNHSVGEYVRDQAHTNGLESFWALFQKGYDGVFHKISPKHLDRYAKEFAGKHNIRNDDTIMQMSSIVAGMVGKRLMYRALIADNGLDSGARG